MNGAPGPYISACRSFSISSTLCLCHLVQRIGRNTKQQRGIVEQKSLKGFVVEEEEEEEEKEEEEDEEGGEGWRCVSVQLWVVTLLHGGEAGIIQHREIIATVLSSQQLFFLSAKLCILVWSENAFAV